MDYAPLLKFTSVKNLTVARYAAAAMAEWVGFCFDPEHPDYINPVNARTIIDWLSVPKIVGEFGNQDPAYINEVVELLNLDQVQLPAASGPELIKSISVPVLASVASAEEYEKVRGFAEWCIAPFQLPGNSIYECRHFSDAELEYIRVNKPPAIDIKGIPESAPGISDLEPLTAFLEQLEESSTSGS